MLVPTRPLTPGASDNTNAVARHVPGCNITYLALKSMLRCGGISGLATKPSLLDGSPIELRNGKGSIEL